MMTAKSIVRALCWVNRGLMIAAGMVLAGGVLGGLIGLSVGAWTHASVDAPSRWAGGFYNGAFYAFIWSIGVSVVACVMQAHHRRHHRGEE